MLSVSVHRTDGVTAASFRGEASASCSGKLLGALQMVHDLRQGLARELLEVRIGAVLNLLLEQRRISLLIVDLAVHIIPVERNATVCLERRNHLVISAMQKRVRRSDIFALQDHIERVDDRNMAGYHQMGVT